MAQALAILEKELDVRSSHFEAVLHKTGIDYPRFVRTVIQACEANPKLLECKRDSVLSAAMSAAVLGLEVDGVTGQAYMIPFAGRAQLVVGYKGYNTMGARSGLTIQGAAIREGDEFDFELGSNPWIRHKPALGKESERNIIAAWGAAIHKYRPPAVSILSIDALMAVKAKSPGAKRSDSPWNDRTIGFEAMCEKTAKRRLARAMPLNVFVLAARMEEAFEEQGRAGHITEQGDLIIDGKVEDVGPPVALGEGYQYKIENASGDVKDGPDGDAWKAFWLAQIAKATHADTLKAIIDRNNPHFKDAREHGDAALVGDVLAAYGARQTELDQGDD